MRDLPNPAERLENVWRKLRLPDRVGFLTAGAVVAIVYLIGLLSPVENALEAFRMKTLQRPATGSVVVVALDAESLRAAGAWPLSRERYARATENLRNAGAAVIGFDIDFSAPSAIGGDEAFAKTVEHYAGMVVLAAFSQSGGRFHNLPLAPLMQNAVVGSVNVELSGDGIVRRYARGYMQGERYFPTLGAILANDSYGETGQFVIDYGIRAGDIDTLSFDDVFNNRFDPVRVRGKNVLIGATALELGDFFATPVSPTMPGVIIHALGYESLIQDRAIVRAGPAITLALALGALAFLWPLRRPLHWTSAARQGCVLFASICAPALVQAVTPLSLDITPVLLAQLISIAQAVRRELARRAEALVQQREEHLAYMASHDPETGLLNRRAMHERILTLSREDNVVLVAAIGVERFALLRNAVGYAAATGAITALAGRLRQIGAGVEVFQFSTSILGILIARPAGVDVARLIDIGLRRLDPRVTVADQEAELFLRVGIAKSTSRSVPPGQLLEQAVLALDHARLQQTGAAMYDAAVEDPKFRLALVNDVTPGLGRGDFEVVYQPKASIRTRTIEGAEALLRWNHPEFGPISPDRFIRVAEETGAIEPLTEWLLARVIEDQARFQQAGIALPVAINLSARSLCARRFCATLIERITQSGAAVSVEITETAVIADPNAALESVAAFRKAGIKLSIDDYGAGQSSITYLKQIEAQELKLDRMLAADVAVNTRDRLVIKSTIDLAHALGMTVVCEGVEDEVSLGVLATLGADSVQGYILARPMTASDMVQFISGKMQSGAQVSDEAYSLPRRQSA